MKGGNIMFVQLHNVNKIYQSAKPVKALQNITLNVQTGEWISIVGPSGSGKTTLLNIIGGMERLSSGEIKVNNYDVQQLSDHDLQIFRRNTIGFVFQDYRLFDQFTVLENVMIPQWPYKPQKEIREKAENLLSILQMSHRLHHLPGELSGGEKQRTAIARALIHEPKILLCDEPTGNLDAENGEIIMDILRSLHKQGMTIFLVTHDFEVAKLGSRKLFIRDGIIQEKSEILS